MRSIFRGVKPYLLATLFTASFAGEAFAACDICAIYVAQQVRNFDPNTVTVGVYEQFTSFEKLQTDGERVPDPAQQFLKGSTTQLFARYDFSSDFAIQGNVPIIARRFRRATEAGIDRGSVSGVGDISLSALYSPYTYQGAESFFRVTLQGGLKLPTGDTDRLREEVSDSHNHGSEGEHSSEEGMIDEHSDHHADHMGSDHHEMGMKGRQFSLKHAGHDHGAGAPMAVHGHDLALGSGSWDLIGGGNFFGQYDLWIVAGSLQYTYRTEGDYDYRYADLLTWDLGFGRYFYTADAGTVALRFNLLGEAKGMDQLNGRDMVDTGVTALFYGPELNFTVGQQVFGLLALDLPAFIDNTETMVVQDYRLRMAVMYRF